MKKLMPKLKGFTIIEVIIVLVIGAVIMLAVFLVVPQLQRTQRNSSRQNAARRVFTAGEQYAATTNVYPQSNTGGTGQNCTGTSLLSTNPSCTEITDITGDVKSPSGVAYGIRGHLTSPTWLTGEKGINDIFISYNFLSCVNNAPATANINKFVVVVRLETSGDPTNWCISN